MRQVDKQALREAALSAKIAGEAPVMPFEQRIDALNSFTKLLTPATAIALLDENESLVRANSAQDDHINQQQDRIDRLEKGIYEAAKQISSWRRIAKQNIAEREKDIAELCVSRQRIAELEDEKEYISKRFKEADLIVGRNLIAMRAAIIEWRATGDAKSGMAWIFNTLIGPGELPSENEKNAQAYFDREDDQIDKEMMDLHKWFWERSKRIEAERGCWRQ
ncbi:ead/Ea22-like family protein [Edwardsiella piscicida]|uniref:ead/Ea22-like family protein n=1 Tax=Edwardsiella piscicida TaxID=1263550 RepID=UPI00370D6E3A